MLGVEFPFLNKIGRHLPHLQSQEIFELGRKNNKRDPAGKPDDNRIGNEFDRGSKTGESED